MPSPDARFSLDGRVAIVTGASKGIGEAIARGLADAGAKVIVSSRNQEAVDEVAASIKAGGGEATGVSCHVGKREQLTALVDKTVEVYGGVDILVNNAATNPVFGQLMDVDEAAFNKIFEVNVRAPMELAKLCHPHMAKRAAAREASGGEGSDGKRTGSVINISSIGGVTPEPGLGVYSVSKAAVISLTKVMAREWGADGVRANVICPGLIKTKFSQAIWTNEELTEFSVGSQPIPRVGDSDELAGMALFLASDASSYCTGAVYMVDGGHCL